MSEVLELPELNNRIILSGYICKKPVYRKTPREREITDLLLAVNRRKGKADYVPCILWSKNARMFADADIGTYVHLVGRIQSRDYIKKLDDDSVENHIAYEVSVSNIDE